MLKIVLFLITVLLISIQYTKGALHIPNKNENAAIARELSITFGLKLVYTDGLNNSSFYRKISGGQILYSLQIGLHVRLIRTFLVSFVLQI